MATSNSTSFSLPLDELLEEAVARAGGEPTLGGEARSARRRALNLLFTDLQNRGVLLHTLQQVAVSLSTSVGTVTVSSDTLDVLDMALRRSSVDHSLERISFTDYLQISNKTRTGRPTRYFVDRQRDAPIIYLWPLPENTTDQMVFWKVRFVQDAGALANDPDFPRRFWPTLVSGLAYFLARSRGIRFPLERLGILKTDYEEDLMRALGEDRDRTTFRIIPGYT